MEAGDNNKADHKIVENDIYVLDRIKPVSYVFTRERSIFSFNFSRNSYDDPKFHGWLWPVVSYLSKVLFLVTFFGLKN